MVFNADQVTVFVATGDPIFVGFKNLGELIGFKLVETKMHVGDYLIVVNIEPSEVAKKITDLICENLPQIASDPVYSEACWRPIILAERKDIKDFCSGLANQHKKQQNLRMVQFRENLGNCVLLAFVIEGYLAIKDLGLQTICNKNPKDLEAAFVKLQIRDGIHVQQTFNQKEHIEWFESVINAILVDPVIHASTLDENGNLLRDLSLEYRESTLKIQKKNNLDALTIFATQLSCYPGISMKMALVIAEQYGSFGALFKAFELAEKTQKAENMLADVMVGNRRLGPARAKQIYENLFMKKP